MCVVKHLDSNYIVTEHIEVYSGTPYIKIGRDEKQAEAQMSQVNKIGEASSATK